LLATSLAISLAVTLPLIGTLVRFRANYTPKGLQLDQDGGVQPHVGPVVSGFWGMLLRIKRLEGLSGFYKGLMPTLLSTTMLTVFAATLMGASFANTQTPGRYTVPESESIPLLLYSVVATFLAIPFAVLTNRAITTPRSLRWFDIRLACQILLTPAERRRPWLLFLIPGLMATQVIHVLYVIIVLHQLRRLVIPSLSNSLTGGALPVDITPFRFVMYSLIVLASVVILCPLEVIATRLSLQKSHAGSLEPLPLPQGDPTVNATNEDLEYSGQGEDVVGLRSEEDPYVGLVDCAKRIINEEGVGVLYRAWYVTFLVAFGGALA